MKTKQSGNIKLDTLLLFLSALVLVTMILQGLSIEPYLGWEEKIVVLMGMTRDGFLLFKLGTLFVVLCVYLLGRTLRNKRKKYKLPEI